MFATEHRATAVDEVLSLPEVEVNDVDAIDFLHVLIVFPAVNILCHKLGGTEQDALEVGVLRLALHLNEQQFSVFVFGQKVNAVLLCIVTVLIALAFQQPMNLHFPV